MSTGGLILFLAGRWGDPHRTRQDRDESRRSTDRLRHVVTTIARGKPAHATLAQNPSRGWLGLTGQLLESFNLLTTMKLWVIPVSRWHTPSRTRSVAEGVTGRGEPFRNALHHLRQERQPPRTLRDYALPRHDDTHVDAIAGADVMHALLPIWFTRSDTAPSVCQLIGEVMKWAVAYGHCPDNRACGALSAALLNNACPCGHQPESHHGNCSDTCGRLDRPFVGLGLRSHSGHGPMVLFGVGVRRRQVRA